MICLPEWAIKDCLRQFRWSLWKSSDYNHCLLSLKSQYSLSLPCLPRAHPTSALPFGKYSSQSFTLWTIGALISASMWLAIWYIPRLLIVYFFSCTILEFSYCLEYGLRSLLMSHLVCFLRYFFHWSLILTDCFFPVYSLQIFLVWPLADFFSKSLEASLL